MTDLTISENTRVTLNFALILEDGSEVDSTFGKAPAEFTIGDGSMLPGFERSLFGLSPGDKAEFQVAPENGFGQPNDNNIQTVLREHFDASTPLEPGMVFGFADASGAEVPGVVVEFDSNEVTIDFNHPLAGRTITFKVEIHDVAAAEFH